MVEPIYFLKPAWCGNHLAGLRPEIGLTARYCNHRLPGGGLSLEKRTFLDMLSYCCHSLPYQFPLLSFSKRRVVFGLSDPIWSLFRNSKRLRRSLLRLNNGGALLGLWLLPFVRHLSSEYTKRTPGGGQGRVARLTVCETPGYRRAVFHAAA